MFTRGSRLLRRSTAAAILMGAVTLLAGCGSGAAAGVEGDKVRVVASFYPLEFVAQRVGGAHVAITDLTAPGAEPHDLELTPQQVASVSDAQLVLYIGQFQPAVDDAVAQTSGTSLDVASGLTRLPLPPTEVAEAQANGQPVPANDPHIWLDPQNVQAIAGAVRDRLSRIDPSHASDYAANATALDKDLAALDHDWAEGTTTCRDRVLVTSHEAFGYLGKRYGFTQLGISGLSPDAEPSAKKVAEVADFVRSHHVSTIYYETLVDPKVAQTVAQETGAATAVLDPLEGLRPGSAGDYLSVMRTNLATLQKGQECS